MKITREYLEKLGACEEQLDLLFKEFPDGGEVTLEKCLRAAELGISLDWAAETLLSARARKAYEEAHVLAWKAYEEVRAPAWEAYREVQAPAWKAYNKAQARAKKVYHEAQAPAKKAYEEVLARAFFAAWQIDFPADQEGLVP